MTNLPSIKIGLNTKRNKFNKSQSTHMTADFGTCIPSFCRLMVPGEKFTLSANSGVRLGTLNVPTMGKISLRHYHYFIPFNSVWFAFDNFLTKSPTKSKEKVNWIPSRVPRISIEKITRMMCNQYGYYSICVVSQDGNHEDTLSASEFFQKIGSSDITILTNILYGITGETGPFYTLIDRTFDGVPNNHCIPFATRGGRSWSSTWNAEFVDKDALRSGTTKYPIEPFGLDGADYIWKVRDVSNYTFSDGTQQNARFYLVCKLGKNGQLVRSIIHGLGYQTGLTDINVNVLKILAYYKAWFTTFQNTLNVSWESTNAYNYIVYSSYTHSSHDMNNEQGGLSLFLPVIIDLGKCYYRIPTDYFSGSTMFNTEAYSTINTENTYEDGIVQIEDHSPYIDVNDGESLSGLKLRLLQYALKYANKYSIGGLSILDQLKAQWGISSIHNDIHEDCIKLGASRQYIEISDVLSTTENENVSLGEYAGRGIGRFKENAEKFTYENNNTFGVWLTISTIVAESGYYQGMLRENELVNPFDFFTPDFDAIGTQGVNNTELFAEFYKTVDNQSDLVNFRDGQFGQLPRYSYCKIGYDLCNGGFTLPSQKTTFDPYQLERQFDCYIGDYGDGHFDGLVNNDLFRTMGYDEKFGNYQRIFNYQPVTPFNYVDRFIIHTLFDVISIAPMKSLSESFDTFENNDKAVMMDKQ